MSRGKQLHSMKAVSQLAEDNAAKLLAGVMERKTLAEQQLAELIGYRAECENQLKITYSRNDTAMSQVRARKAFIERLSDAIAQQQRLIGTLVEELESRVREWRKSHSSNKTLDKLVTQYHHNEQRLQDKRQQRDNDDLSCSRFLRNRPNLF